ncbi:MAG: hypothetical protein WC451_06155 [Patescibacteria group bacterium]
MKILKLKNYFFIDIPGTPSIQTWLENQKLHGKISRNRTRFVRLLIDRIKEINQTKQDLLAKYSEKNKEGKTVYVVGEQVETVDKNGVKSVEFKETETTDSTPSPNKRYKIVDSNGFNKEWAEYIEEEMIIDVTPANAESVYAIRDLLLKSDDDFSGRGAVLYDDWCNAFEEVKDSEGDKKKTE